MKNFLIWIVVILIIFGGFIGISHAIYSLTPNKIFVGIDVSGYMDSVKNVIPSRLSFLNNKKYTLYTLVTNRANKSESKIHSWKSTINLDAIPDIKMYTDLDLKSLIDYPEVNDANKVIIVTNSPNLEDLKGIKNLEVIKIN